MECLVLIYQLKPEGVVNNWLLARLRMCFNVLLCQQYIYLWRQLHSIAPATTKLVVTTSNWVPVKCKLARLLVQPSKNSCRGHWLLNTYNAVLLVWGLLRLAPIKIAMLHCDFHFALFHFPASNMSFIPQRGYFWYGKCLWSKLTSLWLAKLASFYQRYPQQSPLSSLQCTYGCTCWWYTSPGSVSELPLNHGCKKKSRPMEFGNCLHRIGNAAMIWFLYTTVCRGTPCGYDRVTNFMG